MKRSRSSAGRLDRVDRAYIRRLRAVVLVAVATVLAPGLAIALPESASGDTEGAIFSLTLDATDFGNRSLIPEFSRVRNFSLEIELNGFYEVGRRYGNKEIESVRYRVSGSLSTQPPTPSGFSRFALDRVAAPPAGEGPISGSEWRGQGSLLAFEIAPDARLDDGLQLAELVPDGPDGLLFVFDAREFERLDRARYHPPQILLYENGTGLLRNSNNSSGNTQTVNPATGLRVDVDFGDEYVTRIEFDPSDITLVAPIIPEPGTGLLLGLGLFGLARGKRRI